jgi:DNA-binding SARP family transcriptional activator
MMEKQVGGAQSAAVEDIARALLREGQRCALAGFPDQAQALLVQAWSLARDCEPLIANMAAWRVAWLLVQLQAYDKAIEWFGRVETPPPIGSDLWPSTQQSLLQICQIAANLRPTTALLTHIPHTSALPKHSGMLTPLAILSLGDLKIIRDGQILPVCSARKSLAILRYLLTRRHYSAHKEELMELLWPDSMPHDSAHSLHVAIGALRRYLDPGKGSYVLFKADTYSINADAPVSSDCRLFQQLCEEGEQTWRLGDRTLTQQSYIRAIELYRGDNYVDSQDLAWAITERERLLAYYLIALDRLGRIYIDQQHFEQAINIYQRLLERDSFREDAHCQIIRCYQRLGQRVLALRQYERCASILKNELGLEPNEETHMLYQALLGQL